MKSIYLYRDNNVEVRYALNEAIKFTPAKDNGSDSSKNGSSGSKQSRRSQLVNYALQFVGTAMYGRYQPYKWCGLFWLYYESHGEIRRITASLFRLPGPDG